MHANMQTCKHASLHACIWLYTYNYEITSKKMQKHGFYHITILTAFLHLNFARIFLEFADPTSAFWGPCIWHQHFFLIQSARYLTGYNQATISINVIYWLVVSTPLKKYESVGMMKIPIYGKTKTVQIHQSVMWLCTKAAFFPSKRKGVSMKEDQPGEGMNPRQTGYSGIADLPTSIILR